MAETFKNGDKAKPGVVVEIGGVERTLKCTLNALMKIEELTGRNPIVSSEDDSFKPGPRYIATMLWAFLNDGELAVEDVADMIEIADLGRITEALVKAQMQGVPVPDEKGAEEKNEEASS